MHREQAASLGLPVHIVMDAGKTQIARGSRTVLAIAGTHSQLVVESSAFPIIPSRLTLGKKSVVDSVTGHLKLL